MVLSSGPCWAPDHLLRAGAHVTVYPLNVTVYPLNVTVCPAGHRIICFEPAPMVAEVTSRITPTNQSELVGTSSSPQVPSSAQPSPAVDSGQSGPAHSPDRRIN